MEMTSADPAARVPRPLRRRLVGTTLGAGSARPDADASDERIVELWLRDRPANTRVAYERDYARFRAFIGSRGLWRVGLGDLSDFAATLTGSPATRRRTLSAIKALLTTGFKMGALRFNVGAALRLPKVVSRRAERRLEEIEVFRLLTAVEKQPRDRAIIEALYGTGARVDELVQLKRQQLVADIDGPGGYVTLYGKHGGRTIRVGRRTWDALQYLADGKEPDARIIAITGRAHSPDSHHSGRGSGIEEEGLAALATPRARFARPSAGRASGDHPRHARPRLTEHHRPVFEFGADGRLEPLFKILT
jgi:integrase